MHKKSLHFILTTIWLVFWASPSIALDNPYKKAVDAYKNEDYETSHNLILPLAEKGFAQAQYNLGVMYFNGKGVVKNYSNAIKWWNLAADQGNDKAQYTLGLMYEEGKGVKKNLKTAKTWFQLASNQGLAKARKKLDYLLNKTKGHLQENTTSSNELKSSKELKKIDIEVKDLQTTNASLLSELNQIKFEKTKAIEATNQANAETKQERLENLKELKKSYKGIKELQIATANLRSELNQIKTEKTKAIEANNQTNQEAKQKQLESLKELKKSYKEIKNLQTINTSLLSELSQIKSEKTKAIEANNQANTEAKQKQLESLKELKKSYKEIKDLQTINTSLLSELSQIKSEKTKEIEANNQANAEVNQGQLEFLKELKKTYKEIKDLQITNASLHSELNQIKSEKNKAKEATNQTNEKTKQEQLTSVSDKTSKFDMGKVSFRKNAFNKTRHNGNMATETGDHINNSERLHTAINSLGKNEFVLARQSFLNLANKGIAEAQMNLGMMFERGQGVPKDFKEAIRWYHLAADQGLIKAQEKKDSLLSKAATAQINFGLGKRFESGQEVPQDYREAIRFYRLAADLGHIKAQEKLNLILSGKFLDQIKSEKTRGIEATNQAKIEENLNKLSNTNKFKRLKEKNSIYNKSLQTPNGSLHSKPEAIEKDKLIQETNQAIAKIREENLASITEENFTETKDLHTTVTSLQSQLEQIKSDKIRANEAVDQANSKAKADKLASINEFKNLKQKSFKEIKALQIINTSLRSELDKINIAKNRASEAAKQNNSKEVPVITSKELVFSYLNHWVDSWEKKDIEMYLSFYSKDFKGSKESHVNWRNSRKAAIKTHTNISIQLKNIQISQSTDVVEINFTQIFKSDGYTDIGIKEIVWVKFGSNWRIIEETWMPYQSLSKMGK